MAKELITEANQSRALSSATIAAERSIWMTALAGQ
jgi:hypothetical protein